MSQMSSTLNRGSRGNFYSQSRTPSPSSGSTTRVNSGSRSSSSASSTESTPLSSRDTTQQLVTGLSACQRSIEELLQAVRCSNERIEELADKVKTLDSKVDRLSSAAADENDGQGKKRKRTKSSLLVQVSADLLFFLI